MIEVRTNDGIAAIRLAKSVTNPIDLELVAALHGALREIREDPSVRGVVLGSTNEKVLSAWLATRAVDCPPACIQIIANTETSGSAMISAETRSLTCWIRIASRMTTALTSALTKSNQVKSNTFSQSIRLIVCSRLAAGRLCRLA